MIYDIINSRLHDLNRYAKDENEDVVQEGRLKQFVQNLQTDPKLDVQEGETYLDYDIRLNNYQVIQLPDSKRNDYNYVNSALSYNKMRQFAGEFIPYKYFISAGTGKGKNTFIKEELLKKYHGNKNIVILENRESLLSQQKVSIISEIDRESLMYAESDEQNMILFGPKKRFMMISYQAAAKKLFYNEYNFINYIRNAEYIVFDEAHYLLDDSSFNKEIIFIIYYLLAKNKIVTNTKMIFMSASMEEFILFLQYSIIGKMRFDTGNDLSSDYSLDKLDDIGIYNDYFFRTENDWNAYLNLPTDYSYITPFVYNGYESLYERIKGSDDKWLILVSSKEEGYELENKLNNLCGDNTTFFINAENKKKSKNKAIYREIIQNEKFDFKVLIATSVIYNGINIKDEKLRNIVVPETTISVIKQVIGRKRILEGDNRVNVYFPLVDENQIYKRLMGKIREYFDVNNTTMKNICDINSSDSISKYFCCIPINMYNQVYTSIIENIAATTKLHFDTMYYLYLYKRIRDDKDAYIKSILEYMGIPEKFNDLEYLDISAEEDVQDEKDQEEKLYADFVDFLDKYADKSPIEDKRNEDKEYSVIPEFSEKFDEYYRMINHTEKHFDSHFKSLKRCPAPTTFNDIIEKMGLPYTVEITDFDKGTSSKRLIVSRKK